MFSKSYTLVAPSSGLVVRLKQKDWQRLRLATTSYQAAPLCSHKPFHRFLKRDNVPYEQSPLPQLIASMHLSALTLNKVSFSKKLGILPTMQFLEVNTPLRQAWMMIGNVMQESWFKASRSLNHLHLTHTIQGQWKVYGDLPKLLKDGCFVCRPATFVAVRSKLGFPREPNNTHQLAVSHHRVLLAHVTCATSHNSNMTLFTHLRVFLEVCHWMLHEPRKCYMGLVW